ncbi:hypothetical protein [Pseudozobellia sp. WGM2]|uniref:hypothetical protein n=1 Tax=Pseudozobellia sp. WGM2 TaxID=2787625 RepID=UPI001ADEF39D|nr:hypothetical protein [Pseudozobellia sp. WGM2]
MSKPANYQEFELTLENTRPPAEWPEALKALWFAGNNKWEESHNIAQDLHSDLGSWIHAYLHREEGDRFNAGYWYRMAGRSFCNLSLDEEHREITEFALNL